MQPLSSNTLLGLWEIGLYQHPIDRALAILSAGQPEMTRRHLAELTIGQRDGSMLYLWEKTFGSAFKGYSECPSCRQQLEFDVTPESIRVLPEAACSEKRKPGKLIDKNTSISFRSASSIDLAAAANCKDVMAAQTIIIKRCVLEAEVDGKPVEVEELSEDTKSMLICSMAESDPQAEISLDLQCPSCRHKWQMLFDIVTFFWKEISRQARRLLMEVHTLASSYGWREVDILSMSSARRNSYLKMVT
jgi:hypothetical protein